MPSNWLGTFYHLLMKPWNQAEIPPPMSGENLFHGSWGKGPIYLVDQKLGFDPKFGFDPIFGKNPNLWDLQPLGQGIGERGCPPKYYKPSRWLKTLWGTVKILHEKLWGVQNYLLSKHLLKMGHNFPQFSAIFPTTFVPQGYAIENIHIYIYIYIYIITSYGCPAEKSWVMVHEL